MLQKEQEELQRNLGACNSLARQQQENKDIQTIQVLLEQREMLEEELQKGKKCQQELKKEVNYELSYYLILPHIVSCLPRFLCAVFRSPAWSRS